MASSDFLPFATGSGANLESLTTYQGDSRRTNGEQPGQANSARANRAWRQSTLGVAGLAQFCANNGVSMPDDGDVGAFAARVAQAIAGQGDPRYVLKAGDTMTGQLALETVAANGPYTNVLILVPTDYAAGKPGLFLVKGEGSSNTWTLLVADPNGPTGTLNLSAAHITTSTQPRDSAGVDVATLDYALAIGRRFAPQVILDGTGRTQLVADDLGRAVTMIGLVPFTLTAPNPAGAGVRPGDVLYVWNDGNVEKEIAAPSGSFFSVGNTAFPSLRLFPGWKLEAYSDGGQSWTSVQYGPVLTASPLELIGQVQVSNGATNYDYTWSAGTYSEVVGIMVDVVVQAAGTGPLFAFSSSAGWANTVFGNSSSTNNDMIRFEGTNLDRSVVVSGGNAVLSNPGVALGGGNVGAGLARHDGGMTGIRLTTGNPGAYPLQSGIFLVYGRRS